MTFRLPRLKPSRLGKIPCTQKRLFQRTNPGSKHSFNTYRSTPAMSSVSHNKMLSAQEAFGAKDFDVERYLSNRPRYPPHLYSFIRAFLSSESKEPTRTGTLLDLGCGPGFAAFPLLQDDRFDRLIGVDTSKGMVQAALPAYRAWLSTLPQDSLERQKLVSKQVSFAVASSSDLRSEVKDESVTLAMAATAAHWFDYTATWSELSRVVQPGGAVIFFTYGENYLPRHPELQGDIFYFMQGDSTEGDSIGPYFPQPGRSYLANLLRDVPFPHEVQSFYSSTSSSERDSSLSPKLIDLWDLTSATRKTHPLAKSGLADLSWTSLPSAHLVAPEEEPFRLEQVMSWERYESYIRSASAFQVYMRQHPQEKQGPEDVVGRYVKGLRAKVLDERRRGLGVEEGLDDQHIRVAWPLGLMAIKKKEQV